MTLLLVTSSPHSHAGKLAVEYAAKQLHLGNPISVFFYGDGAYTANRLMWQTADVPSVAKQWQVLANDHGIALPVCVSTALARGVCDAQNAARHGLTGDNLLSPFYLVGLSELAMMIDDASSVMQF
ncbi:sulfurtransferase complex subunit TusD [Moraxella canis]|uniref:Multidrug transporter n=1 Tax=Moraxella canis TaxID=90239 RepID=A0A1S9ZMR4_9GAMM|nr:sulfurtransferase complex subunit TusD [Moraxella canis]OOR84736.1 multidrug transporter [Moraxella canis]WQE04236.1 sulfurtransferase complex subunit TusD [Moraxella canis]